jgi:hypothetical protein
VNPADPNPIIREADLHRYLATFNQQNERRDHAHPSPRQVVEGLCRSPFVEEVARADKPRHFQEPTFKLYDGKADPADHLSVYLTKMSYWAYSDAALCRSFAASLGEKGLDWFRRLPEGQIRDFNELSEIFIKRFRIGRKKPKTLADLYALKKGKTETLRAYANRFWDLYDAVREPPQGKIDAFKMGLSDSPFLYDSLTKKPPSTAEGLAERIEKYILVDESRKQQLADGSGSSQVKSKAFGSKNSQSSGGNQQGGSQRQLKLIKASRRIRERVEKVVVLGRLAPSLMKHCQR